MSSGFCRWALPGRLTLIATKRLLGTATGAGPNGGCTRYYGHWAPPTRRAPRHRSLLCCLDWRCRPIGAASATHCERPVYPGI